MTEYIQAGQFKAKCLKIMDKVCQSKRRVVITKHNKPVVQIMPIEDKRHSLFGSLKGTIHIQGDLIGPI